MLKHESYSFTRLFLDRNIEFFFILGINESDNFDEFWDGRHIDVLGYAVIYIDFETNKQKNLIYLINKNNIEYEKVIKYTKQFIQNMSLSEKFSDRENITILRTYVDQRVVHKPYEEFIKLIVKNEIPEFGFIKKFKNNT